MLVRGHDRGFGGLIAAVSGAGTATAAAMAHRLGGSKVEEGKDISIGAADGWVRNKCVRVREFVPSQFFQTRLTH